jgi:A/G-specific adenine glycosylase
MADRTAIEDFCLAVRDHAARQGRDLPWRKTTDPWLILLAEVMLQQTQVERVKEKFLAFAKTYPSPAALAAAAQADVLRLWKGLGYNRRALYLKRAAEIIVGEHDGAVPDDADALSALPGIGRNTAAAILAYAFNRPVVFIETNIRAAFIHHFFPGDDTVHDRDLSPLVEAALDRHDPRGWYNALMDYGADLKRRAANPARRSAHHAKQSRFEGSDRQLRGRILEILLAGPRQLPDLIAEVGEDGERLGRIIADLEGEGFVRIDFDAVRLR